MLRRLVIGCLLAIGVSGCAGGPALFGPSTGTVTGHVSVRVCGGAYRLDQTGCSTRPVADAIVSFRLISANGAAPEQTAVTDASGAYIIKLTPGTYTVTLSAARVAVLGSSRPSAGKTASRQVTVSAGKTVTADVTFTIQLL
jgi:hypothetical protein